MRRKINWAIALMILVFSLTLYWACEEKAPPMSPTSSFEKPSVGDKFVTFDPKLLSGECTRYLLLDDICTYEDILKGDFGNFAKPAGIMSTSCCGCHGGCAANDQIPYLVEDVDDYAWEVGDGYFPDIFHETSTTFFPVTDGKYFKTQAFIDEFQENFVKAYWADLFDITDEVEWENVEQDETVEDPPTGGASVPLGGGGSEAYPTSYGGGFAKIIGSQEIMSPPTVTYPINWGFEDWTDYLPDHWNKSGELGGVNIPSIWGSGYYYPNSCLIQTNDEYSGTYAIRLRTYTVNKVLASSWYEIPQAYRINYADWYADIRYKANTAAAQATDLYLAYEVQFLDVNGNSQGGTPSLSGVFDPNNNTSYVAVQTPNEMYSSSPHYVRFAIRQIGGTDLSWYVRFDEIHLYNGYDVALPVSLDYFHANSIFYQSGWKCGCEWATWSELNNDKFWLYYEHPTNGLTKASGAYEQGAGTSSQYNEYDKDFLLYTSAMQYWWSLDEGDTMWFQIVTEDYSSDLHYYPEEHSGIEQEP